MEKGYRMERFNGLTLGINPIFTVIALIYLSITKTKGLLNKLKSDRISLYFWLLFAISGLISVLLAVDKGVAFTNYLIPFLFIWLYILGRWTIQNPARFLQDLIRGVAVLSLIAVIAQIFKLNWSIGNFDILARFPGRGEILYISDNGLGLLFQVGVVGSIGSLILYWKEKRYFVENIIALILSAFALVISGSRGAMLGSLVGLLFVTKNSLIPLFYAGLVTIFLYFFSAWRFLSIFQLKEHTARIWIWKSSLKIIKDYPLFGVGPGNFTQIYEHYKPEILKDLNVTCPHSNYLSIFIGWGLIGGLLFWGWQLFILVRAAVRGLTPLQRVILAILVSFYAHTTVNDLFAAYSGFLLGLIDHQSFKKENWKSEEQPSQAF